MGDVVVLNPPICDGGKARIQRRRAMLMLDRAYGSFRLSSEGSCDLSMLHADNGMPSDSSYCAPEADPA